MSHADQAEELIRIHGIRAPQLLVDRLVGAVKAGDEGEILSLDSQLKAVERLLEQRRVQEY